MGSDEVVHGSRVRLRAVVEPGEHLTDVTRHDDGVQVLSISSANAGELARASGASQRTVDDLGRDGFWFIELAPREGALDEFLVPIDERGFQRRPGPIEACRLVVELECQVGG